MNAKPKATKKRYNGDHIEEQNEMADLLDQLDEFAQFKKTIFADLRKAAYEKWDAEKIRKEFAPLLQIRAIQMAASEQDTGKAMGAIKDILDRAYGKPVEKLKVEHAYETLPDEQLDSMIASKRKELGLDDAPETTKKKQH